MPGMKQLPSGTVSFVFTDIERSTQTVALPEVRAELDPERARQLRDEGRAMSLDEALAYALET